ncbi:hypothetical protein IPG36_02270 [bacterium]|nr:MAG: hypothetical protein IPG36_02270 [bacterium]
MTAQTTTQPTNTSTDAEVAQEVQEPTAAPKDFFAPPLAAHEGLAALVDQLNNVGAEMAPEATQKPDPHAQLKLRRETYWAKLREEQGLADDVMPDFDAVMFQPAKGRESIHLVEKDIDALKTMKLTGNIAGRLKWLLDRLLVDERVGKPAGPKSGATKAPAKATKLQYPVVPPISSEWDKERRDFYRQVVRAWDWKTCESFQANFARQKGLPQEIWFMLNFKKCGQFIEAVLRQALVLALVERERQAGKEDEYLALAAGIEGARASEAAKLAELADCGRVVDPTKTVNPVHRVEVTADRTPEEIEQERIAFWSSVPRELREEFKARAAKDFAAAMLVVRKPKKVYTPERIQEMVSAISVAERLLRVIQREHAQADQA